MDRIFIVPHTHYDAEVFKTREEYLEWGFLNILDALKMLSTHSDYKFVLDQVAYIKPFIERYPELRNIFQNMIDSGRLEIVCGMYVMPDVNIPSGESFIKQIQVGKEYCRKEFGVDVKIGWMIDTFGHHPQIPQLMVKSGFNYYVFGRVTRETKSEFFWEGIDGSRILCHWTPFMYIVFCNSPGYLHGFKHFVHSRYNLLKKYAVTENIIAMEGGDLSAPTIHLPDMVNEYNRQPERVAELKIATPTEFFKEIEKYKDALRTTTDDFNPVFQGCYSARIEVKQWNRYLENLLYTGEFLNALVSRTVSKINRDFLDEAWELVLFNHFHDVICGCHVDKVFEKVVDRYKQSEFMTKKVIQSDIDSILERIDTSGEGIPVVVFNQLNWEREDVAEVQIGFTNTDVFELSVVDSKNGMVACQLEEIEHYENGAIKQAKVVFIAKVPSLGYEVYRVLPNVRNNIKNKFQSDEWYGISKLDKGILENEFYRIEVDLWTGAIKSIILKDTGEELVDPSMPLFNTIVKESDDGDFWEVKAPLKGGATRPVNRIFPIPEKGCALFSSDCGGSSSVQKGDIKTDFHFKQRSSYGEFSTTVRLYSALRRVEIITGLVNNEENVRYRAIFPTNVRNGKVVYEIPFGSIERPEGEFPAQNWVDYSDSQKGIGLLNCGLPGNAVIDNTLFLSLLKCTSYVQYGQVGGFDAATPAGGGFEKGKQHKFRYAIIPHKGTWKEAELYKRGLELNNPLIVQKCSAKKGPMEVRKSFLSVDKPNVVISSVKRKDSSIVVRLYEAAGNVTNDVSINFSLKINSAVEVNLLEEETANITQGFVKNDHKMAFSINPFEIKTFKLELE